MTKVKRTEQIYYPFLSDYEDPPEWLQLEKTFTGRIIWTNTSFRYWKTITVIKDIDGTIVEIPQHKLKVVY